MIIYYSQLWIVLNVSFSGSQLKFFNEDAQCSGCDLPRKHWATSLLVQRRQSIFMWTFQDRHSPRIEVFSAVSLQQKKDVSRPNASSHIRIDAKGLPFEFPLFQRKHYQLHSTVRKRFWSSPNKRPIISFDTERAIKLLWQTPTFLFFRFFFM